MNIITRLLLKNAATFRKVAVTSKRLYKTVHPECNIRPRNPFYDPYYEESVWSCTPRCQLGSKNLVTMAPGVGMGPELMEIVKRVCMVANAPIIFEEIPMGADADDKEMDNLLYAIERNGVAIKGNIEPKMIMDKDTNRTEITRNILLRRSLDLFVNVVEVKSFPALVAKTRLKKDVDVVLVRLNTDGEFAMLEHEIGKGIENLTITTKYNTRRLAVFAFKYAVEHNRTKVAAVYNGEYMQMSEGLFLDTLYDVAADYSGIEFEAQDIHKFIYHMSTLNLTSDVLVTNAYHGVMIESLLFGLTNGFGLFCAQNIGPRYAVFEPAARNKGYKLAGKDAANPVAALVCAANLLRYLGHPVTADRIERAVRLTVNEDLIHTADMLGEATCSQVVANVERRIRETMSEGYNWPLPPFQCGDSVTFSEFE